MLCIGHAGASDIAPANSLSAFALATALGADQIEFDVRAWRGRLLLAHTAFDAQFGRPLRLDDALAALSAPRFAGVDFVIDLKSAGTARAVVDALRRRGLFERSLITSQSPLYLAAVRRVAPSARVGISIAGRLSRRLQHWGEWRGEVLAALVAGHYDAVMVHHRLIDRDLVARVGADGAEMHAWTVGCPQAMRSLAGLGVDGIVTGDPRLLRATIAAWRPRGSDTGVDPAPEKEPRRTSAGAAELDGDAAVEADRGTWPQDTRPGWSPSRPVSRP